MIQVLTEQDYRKMPWKNGQGFTLEIARSHGEGLENFDWRVSIADVKEAGAFSHFPNKQRVIGVLEGIGLTLHVDENRPVTLMQKQFFAFHGESNVHAELVDGVIRDFNLIYNPEKYLARFQWLNTSSVSSWISDASQILIFNTSAKLNLRIDEEMYSLKVFETLLVKNKGTPLQIVPEAHGSFDFCVIELFLKS